MANWKAKKAANIAQSTGVQAINMGLEELGYMMAATGEANTPAVVAAREAAVTEEVEKVLARFNNDPITTAAVVYMRETVIDPAIAGTRETAERLDAAGYPNAFFAHPSCGAKMRRGIKRAEKAGAAVYRIHEEPDTTGEYGGMTCYATELAAN